MSKEIRIEKTVETIYRVGISDKFRIVQNGDEEFVIEKLFKKTDTKGYLWWKKTSSRDEWKTITIDGQKLIINRYYTNYAKLKTYKTLEEAVKWIEDYNKYPIYH